MAGGHPKESLEATFDIVQDEANCRGHQLEAEALLVVCQVMSNIPNDAGESPQRRLKRETCYL